MLVVALLLGCLALDACGGGHSSAALRQQPAGLLVAHDHAVYMRDPTSGSEHRLLTVGGDHLVSRLARSPDGTRFAYVSTKPASEWRDIPPDGGGDIYIADANGGNQRLVLPHDQPGADIGSLAWTGDGMGLVYTYVPPGGGTGTDDDVRRLDLASRTSVSLVTGAEGAGLCSDGSRLAFNKDGRLWLGDGDGQHALQLSLDGLPVRSSRPIASSSVTVDGAPVFSPDCTQISFAGSYVVLGPVDNGPFPGHVPEAGEAGRWTIAVKGTAAWQVPAEDNAACSTWAPDGRALLALLHDGLLRVPLQRGQADRIGPGIAGCDSMA